MQDALLYRTWTSNRKYSSKGASSTVYLKRAESHDLKSTVDETPVIIFMKHGDCMGHVLKSLLQVIGVNPAVYEVHDKDEIYVSTELTAMKINGRNEEGQIQFPVAFIGGQLFGGLDRVMATHLTGELTSVLKQSGALWL